MAADESVDETKWLMVYPYAVVVNGSKVYSAVESRRKSMLVIVDARTSGLYSVSVIITFKSGVIVVGEDLVVVNSNLN